MWENPNIYETDMLQHQRKGNSHYISNQRRRDINISTKMSFVITSRDITRQTDTLDRVMLEVTEKFTFFRHANGHSTTLE